MIVLLIILAIGVGLWFVVGIVAEHGRPRRVTSKGHHRR